MLADGHLYGERVWFHDTRSPARRMGVSTHPFDSTVVISFWQGNACTGTFRLPVADAARLVSTLAFGMADAIPEEGDRSPGGPTRSSRTWWRLVRRLFVRAPATTRVPLRLLK
jgi:hypothetical protein